MSHDPILIAQAQAGAALNAQQKVAQIINTVELFRQWSAMATVDEANLQPTTMTDQQRQIWRAGAAAGRALAYNRCSQHLQQVLQGELAAAEPLSSKVLADLIGVLIYFRREAPAGWCNIFQRLLDRALEHVVPFGAWCPHCEGETKHLTGTETDLCIECGHMHEPLPF